MPMVKFTPTDEQREDVAVKASVGRLSQEEIAQTIINPRTNRPITAKTLSRMFRKELRDTEYKKRILDAFWKKVDDGEWRAIEFGMTHIVGFGDKANNKGAATFVNNDFSNWKIIGVTPNPALAEPPPIEFERAPASAPRIPYHPAPQLDSSDERAVQPLYGRVEQPEQPPPVETPRTFRERREALEERARIEGWPAENPRIPGNWRKGRYV